MRGAGERGTLSGVSVADRLVHLGGVATRGALIRSSSRREVDAALVAGHVVRLARGRYALPQTDEAVAAAHALSGVVCLVTAAILHGWAVKSVPERPHVALPRNRHVSADRARTVEVKRLRLGPGDVTDGVTTQDRTLADCLRLLLPDEGMAIADSALRAGYSRARMLAITRDARGPGAAQMRRVAALATPEAANPFESVLRAIALCVPGLEVRPQVPIHRSGNFLGRPDLVDEHLRIVLEADSFQWHGGRAALRSDALRYNAFVVDGWLVLRFSWEDVMFRQDDVRSVLAAAVAERTERQCPTCRATS